MARRTDSIGGILSLFERSFAVGAFVRHLESAHRDLRPLKRPSQSGMKPLSRGGLGDDLIDVIAIDALERAHLEPNPRRLYARKHHWT
jgi:hypothetical protein